MPTTVSGFGGKVSLALTTIRELEFAGYPLKDVPLHILEDTSPVSLFEYPSLSGLIGNEILRRFNIILNYGKKEFCLKPNIEFSKLFDYSYTGLEMNFAEGEILIGEVFSNTPAFRAGLKEGDSVIAIDDDFSRNLQSYNLYLQEIGKTYEITVLRNNVQLKLTLTVESIK